MTKVYTIDDSGFVLKNQCNTDTEKKKYRTEDLEKRTDDSEMKLSDTNELVKNRL